MSDKKKRPRKPKGIAQYIEGKCIACGARCQSACPVDAIEMNENDEPIILAEKCIGCKKCVKVCPSEAIEMYYTPDEQKILAEYSREELEEVESIADKTQEWKGVWVFVEHTDGTPHPVSWELLGEGRKLANELNTTLSAFILGEDIHPLVQEALAYGAEYVYSIEDPLLRYYRTSTYLQGGLQLIRKYKPEIVLIGATGQGRDLAGAMATELQTGLTADCTGLTIDRERRLLEQTRPAFGGNIMATILTETARPQMASVRPHVMAKPEYYPGRKGKEFREVFYPPEEKILTRILDMIPVQTDNRVNLAGANIIVSGGRGMMGPENFHLIQTMAELLGGVVGCSRGVVDAGWMPQSHQVGQTGKTVKPKLYIACGISGAIQHLVGMQTSDYIIAINKDRNAPIFDVAHLGIVGDVFDVLPPVIDRLQAQGSAQRSIA